ncbi:hypothetical protein A0J48_022325 [Sphaerospermopsis aphanizomenoides BCCUSP55]|uniref:hypothetical protein n=1 Tax=Sphaerospermopsis aphanizomenoides TaxID=459663 RepID=UPI000A74C5E3|nr:hypothetical protein [Sphaerospermopsis aphanizomenoides]MBK1990226.1 hypothetical protein [Sphaerospermopsis aphanizomenoides BCCUSP55]
MSKLSEEYPMLHIYTSKGARQPVVIKGNTEGLCTLVNALISAIAHPQSSEIAEVFNSDAETYEVVVHLVTTHNELSPVPEQN